MFNSIIDIAEEAGDITLPVVGQDYAHDLVDYLDQNGINILPLSLETPDEPDQAFYNAGQLAEVRTLIRSRQYDYVLVIPPDFDSLIGASRRSNIELHLESTRTKAAPQTARISSLIDSWGRETASLRLLARGISPQLVSPVTVVSIDIASQQSRVQRLLGMVPFFVLMAAFVCGMGVAVDVTAGERERKSLEPLLVNPVPRSTIVIGKWLAAVTFSATGLILVLVLNFFSLSRIPLEEVGIVFNIGTLQLTGILLTILPMSLLAPAIQIFIGIFARSFKDAQGYLSFVMLLPMIPFFYNMFNTQDRAFWMNFVPMLGQHMLLNDVVRGEAPGITDFVVAGVSLFIYSMFFVYAASRLIRKERIIFS